MIYPKPVPLRDHALISADAGRGEIAGHEVVEGEHFGGALLARGIDRVDRLLGQFEFRQHLDDAAGFEIIAEENHRAVSDAEPAHRRGLEHFAVTGHDRPGDFHHALAVMADEMPFVGLRPDSCRSGRRVARGPPAAAVCRAAPDNPAPRTGCGAMN